MRFSLGLVLSIMLLGSLSQAGLNSSLDAVVKVVSKGPPGAPVLASSGVFLRREGLDLVVTTSHGMYNSNIVGQFFAQNNRDQQIPCRILISSYEYDLTLLQCQASSWTARFDLPFTEVTDDYYRGGSINYAASILSGYPADSARLLVEQVRGEPSAVFLKAPQEMLVPGVKAHYLALSDQVTEGMSGGILAVSNSRDSWEFAGIISKKIAFHHLHIFRSKAASVAAVIPASTVSGFIDSTLWSFKNGKLKPVMGDSNYTIFQGVEARLEHPLNVRVGPFAYAMEDIVLGSRRVKTIRVIPDDNLDMRITYSPYRGVNDFKRALMVNRGCELRVIAASVGVDNGRVYTHENYFPLPTYESALSLLILAEGQTNWMGLRGAVMRMDCPDQAKRIDALRELVRKFRSLGARYKKEYSTELAGESFIQSIETRILAPESGDLFPMNFVLPLNSADPCQDQSARCQRKLEAGDLLAEIDRILSGMFRKI